MPAEPNYSEKACANKIVTDLQSDHGIFFCFVSKLCIDIYDGLHNKELTSGQNETRVAWIKLWGVMNKSLFCLI